MFSDQTILITGGTGSFGHAVMKRFLNTDVKEIRILSRDEKKQDDMRKHYRNSKLKFFIGDIRDTVSLKDAMYGVDIVFHAAALKQVPSCEFFPMEAVKTNVIGTENVLSVAIENGVRKVVCLSTDKAAYPINAMGMSKAMMEKVVVAKSRMGLNRGTIVSCTRFGNVMASRGSVIPLFIEQINSGKPITLTNLSMTRFLMSMDEAVELVIYAFMNAQAGDIIVHKSPACTIADLAQAIKEVLRADNEIVVTGIRHGEKWHETLLTKEEFIVAEELNGFYTIPADLRDLNYENHYSRGKKHVFTKEEEYTSYNTHQLNLEDIKKKLVGLDCIREEMKRRSIQFVT
jgi:UDP-N-acetylglucosamine 4,6-dehydratase